MGLGSRTARQHDTVGIQAKAVQSELWWDHKPNDHVMTVDGFPGVVTAVLDGPHPGNEAYDVVLDNGMGQGLYTSGQLRPLEHVTASEVHTAADDYEELRDVLSAPDPGKKIFTASKNAEDDGPQQLCWQHKHLHGGDPYQLVDGGRCDHGPHEERAKNILDWEG